MALGAVAELLFRGLAEAGDVTPEGFVPWGTSPAVSFERILSELDRIPPGEERPGDVFWLNLHASGEERGRTARDGMPRASDHVSSCPEREVRGPMTSVELPWLRYEIASAVSQLADTRYQKERWLDPPVAPGQRRLELQTVIRWLVEDTSALEAPEELAGAMLYPDEVPALRALGKAFLPLVLRYEDASDHTYLADPSWPEVVAAAATARDCLEANGAPPVEV